MAPPRPDQRDRPDLFQVRRRDQLEALTSPARQEIVDGFQAIGPCSISTLAEALGRAPDSLYYHIRKLESVGLLVSNGQTKAGRRDAAVYDVVGRHLYIDHKAIGQKARPMLIKAGSAMLRSAEREMREALNAGEPIGADRDGATTTARSRIRGRGRGPGAGPERGRRLTFGRIKARLTPADLEKLSDHLQAIAKLLAASRGRSDGDLFTFTYCLAPVRPAQRHEH